MRNELFWFTTHLAGNLKQSLRSPRVLLESLPLKIFPFYFYLGSKNVRRGMAVVRVLILFQKRIQKV